MHKRQGIYAKGTRNRAKKFFAYNSFQSPEETENAARSWLLKNAPTLQNGYRSLSDKTAMCVEVLNCRNIPFICIIKTSDFTAFKENLWKLSIVRTRLYRWHPPHVAKQPRFITPLCTFNYKINAIECINSLNKYMQNEQIYKRQAFFKWWSIANDKTRLLHIFNRWVIYTKGFIFV